MPQPAVSIIMPAYNVTAYIETALRSVFAQSFTDYELIVVNDGCPDTENLERVLAPYRQRITYLRQENAGVGAARRAAVLMANAPFIAQLDPDDWWEPDYLQVQLKLLESNPEIDLIYPNGRYFGDPAMEGKLLMDYAPSAGEATLSRLLKGDVNILYPVLARKKAILQAGNFDPELRTSEDFDLWIRILHAGGKVAYHRDPLFHYRLRNTSLTSAKLHLHSWILKVLDKTERTLLLNKEETEALEQRRVATQMEMELGQGKEAVKRRDWAAARWHFGLYQRYRPNRKLSLVLFLLRSCPFLLSACLNARDRLLESGMLKAKRPQSA
jgi:glycosyltransferase involved in cell wall biosynthesis